jgi:hypothetical protein
VRPTRGCDQANEATEHEFIPPLCGAAVIPEMCRTSLSLVQASTIQCQILGQSAPRNLEFFFFTKMQRTGSPLYYVGMGMATRNPMS